MVVLASKNINWLNSYVLFTYLEKCSAHFISYLQFFSPVEAFLDEGLQKCIYLLK